MNIRESLIQAQLALKEKDIDQAKYIYILVLETDPKNFIANTNLGILYIEDNLLEKGLSFLKIALETNPLRKEAWINYIKYLMMAEKFEIALELIIKARINLLSDHNLDQLEAICSFGIKSNIEDDRKLIFLFLRGGYQEILELNEKLENMFLYDSYYQYLIGVCLIERGFYRKSILRLKKSIQLNSKLIDAYRLLIGMLYKFSENEDAKKYNKVYIGLKSKYIKTNSNIKHIIDIHLEKIESQDGTYTFFDNAVSSHIKGINTNGIDYCHIYESLNNSKENRFISYFERIIKTKNQSQLNGLPLLLSQGTHSLIKWKELSLYKTTNDLVLYWMILNELKPDIIIELGSGSGGSAVWMSDISKALGFKTEIYSYDINKPDFNYKDVNFIEFDINQINSNNGLPFIDSLNGKSKLVIEDAHVNVLSVLYTLDRFLEKGDYLVIEDSMVKHQEISKFLEKVQKTYKLDQFYLDFFGVNMSCSIDSIFKIF